MSRERENRAQKKSGGSRSWLVALIIILAVVLVVLIGVVAYVESMMGLISDATVSTMSSEEIQEYIDSQTEETDPDFTGPVMDATDVTWVDETEPIEQSENIINILLVGQDRRPGETIGRSDSMILCTLNKTTKTVTLTSFMRDTYVKIPGHSANRINASYAWGGFELLDKTLEANFGVQVDGYVGIDFSGFVSLVDMIGGVEINLTAEEAQYLNYPGNWNREGEFEDEPDVYEGVNLLSGPRALGYARARYIGNGDFGRTERQRTVLTALAEKAKTLSIFEFNSLLKAALPLMSTDMSNAQIIALALDVFPMLADLEFVTQRIPADGAYQMTMIDGMSVLLPNLEKNKELLKDCMKDEVVQETTGN